MQNAETVLSILREKSKVKADFRYDRLYRNLFNHEFYLNAYGKIYNKEA